MSEKIEKPMIDKICFADGATLRHVTVETEAPTLSGFMAIEGMPEKSVRYLALSSISQFEITRENLNLMRAEHFLTPALNVRVKG